MVFCPNCKMVRVNKGTRIPKGWKCSKCGYIKYDPKVLDEIAKDNETLMKEIFKK